MVRRQLSKLRTGQLKTPYKVRRKTKDLFEELSSGSESTSLITVSNCDTPKIAFSATQDLSKIWRVKRKCKSLVAKLLSTFVLNRKPPPQIPVLSCPPDAHFRVIDFIPNEQEGTVPKAAYMSLSSDLRLLLVRSKKKSAKSLPRIWRPAHHFQLKRMDDLPHGVHDVKTPLRQIVASRVTLKDHPHGQAIYISEENKSILIFVKEEEERHVLFLTLQFHVAPHNALLHCLKGLCTLQISSRERMSVAQAIRGMVGLDAESEKGGTSEETYRGILAKRLSEILGNSARAMNGGSHFGRTIAGSAEGLERMAKIFSQVGVFGCVVSLFSLFTKAVYLFEAERNGMKRLRKARITLRDASYKFFEWLGHILRTGFQDDELIKRMFDAMMNCWDKAAKLEKYMLKNRPGRVLHANDIEVIEESITFVRKELSDLGILKKFSNLRLLLWSAREMSMKGFCRCAQILW